MNRTFLDIHYLWKVFSSLKQLSVDGEQDSENLDSESNEAIPIEQTDEWRTKSKHIFILSEAGKPIYSLLVNSYFDPKFCL